MLIGEYSSNLGPKRRLAIPKAFRLFLGEKFLITRWYEGCLVLVAKTSWEKVLDRLREDKKLYMEATRDTERLLIGSAFELTPDSQGRAVVPDVLVEYAKLTNKVSFIGLGDRVEVWSEATWVKRKKQIEKDSAEILARVARGK